MRRKMKMEYRIEMHCGRCMSAIRIGGQSFQIPKKSVLSASDFFHLHTVLTMICHARNAVCASARLGHNGVRLGFQKTALRLRERRSPSPFTYQFMPSSRDQRREDPP
jgi:hypothetical protein